MQKYRVTIRGENFLILGVHLSPVKHGFITYWFGEAESPEAAELCAVDAMQERDLNEEVLNDEYDPPMLYADEIVEIDHIPANLDKPLGLAWYSANGDADDIS